MSLYFDNNATTVLAPEAFDLLQKASLEPMNPSARHLLGQRARSRLETARCKIADLLKARPAELLWTSGATEGINLCLQTITDSLASSNKEKGEILICPCEHAATLETAKHLEKNGWKLRFLKGANHGSYDVNTIVEQITQETKVLALMAANNETGAIQPIDQLAKIIASDYPDIHLIVDAVAAFTKLELTFTPGIRAMIFSGHKFHALQGSGFVLMRSIDQVEPFLFGGGQEHGVRCGTVNFPGVLSLEAAVEIYEKEPKIKWMQHLRLLFEKKIFESIPGVHINGPLDESQRLCNTSNLYFEQIDAEALLIALERRGLYASQGSACSSGLHASSHVLSAMGYTLERAQGSIRFSLSRYSQEEEIIKAVEILVQEVALQRASLSAF